MPGSSSTWLTEKRGGIAAVLFALATRMAHYIGYLLGQRTELYYWPVLACRKFESAAAGILQGDPGAGPFTYASPLYRYFLLPFYAAEAGRTGLFVFQSLLGVLTAWMIFRLALRAGAGTGPALAGAAGWSLYAPAVFFELTILPVSLLTLLITGFTLLQTGRGANSIRSAGSGLIAGLISGLRPPFILLLGTPVWKYLRNREWRNLLILFPALLLPLLFLSYQHERAGGGFYPFPRTAGTNLVLGHSSQSSGYGPPIPSLGLVETGRGDIHEVAAEAAADLGYSTPAEADAYWMRTALSWIAENPLEELRLMAVKVGGFFGAGAFDTYYEMGRVRSFNPVFRLFFVPRFLLVMVFLAGLVSFCVGGKHRAAILAPVAVALLSTVVFVHSERYFLPALPLMAAAGVSGLTVLFRRAGTAPLRWAAAGITGLLLMLPSLIYPVPRVPEEMFIGSLAVRAHHMEDYVTALELFERAALLARRGSVVWVQGHSEAAGIARALGNTERAEQHENILQEAGFLPN
ncbi:MAG: hypothetical protein R6U39_04670 [Candidatus Aegiribacteria sp.]